MGCPEEVKQDQEQDLRSFVCISLTENNLKTY